MNASNLEAAGAFEGVEESIAAKAPRLVVTRADLVLVERVEWFSPLRIPLGGITLFDGPGGIGKTTFITGVIAAASNGRDFFTGGEIEPASSLIVGVEDRRGLSVQRLRSCGAVMPRVHFVDTAQVGGRNMPLCLPDHTGILERTIVELGVSLVYVDALFAHISLDGDGRMSQQVRAALQPIVEMCERQNIAFAAMRHWTKAAGPALSRALGSVEFTNVARSVFTFGRHPNDESLSVCAHTKSNYGKLTGAVGFRLDVQKVLDDNGQPWEVSIAAGVAAAEGISSDDLAMRAPCDPDERGSAAEWLRDYLADGREHLTSDVCDAAKKAGVGSRTTLWRAAKVLEVTVGRTSSYPSVGTWTLPGESEQNKASSPLELPSRSISHIYATTGDSAKPREPQTHIPQGFDSRSTVVPPTIHDTAGATAETTGATAPATLKVSERNSGPSNACTFFIGAPNDATCQRCAVPRVDHLGMRSEARI